MLMKEIREYEKEQVKKLGQEIGNIMNLARDLWREELIKNGYPAGGEFSVGPCMASMVPCICGSKKNCDYCCGTGIVTKAIKKLIS